MFTVAAIVMTLFLLVLPVLGAETVPGIDLRSWDPAREGIRELSGSWGMVPGQLLEELPDSASELEIVTMPYGWTGGTGYATFAVTLLLPAGPHELALRIEPAATAYRLFVNGTERAASGIPGTSREQTVPRLIMRTAPLSAASDYPETVDLVLQISNFHHRRGGMWRPIRIGTRDQLLTKDLIDMSYDLLLLGVAVAFALYNLLLYAAGSRRSPAPLILGLFFLAVAVRVPTLGSLLLTRVLPDTPWHLHLGIEYFSGHLIVGFLATTLQLTWPRDLGRWYGATVVTLMGLFTLWLLVGGVTAYSMTIHLFIGTTVAVLVYPLVQLTRTVRKGSGEAAHGIIAVAVVLAIVLSEWAHFTQIAPSRDGLPFGFLTGLLPAPTTMQLPVQLALNGVAIVVVILAGGMLLYRISRGIFESSLREAIPPTVVAPPGDPMDLPALTRRENEIARLVAHGLSNREVGALLHISEATVRTHLYRVFRKAGVSNRTELARLIRGVSSAPGDQTNLE